MLQRDEPHLASLPSRRLDESTRISYVIASMHAADTMVAADDCHDAALGQQRHRT